jgi:hypothetical protein
MRAQTRALSASCAARAAQLRHIISSKYDSSISFRFDAERAEQFVDRSACRNGIPDVANLVLHAQYRLDFAEAA